MAALQLLSIAATRYGKDELAVRFLRAGVRMGESIGLFGVRSGVKPLGLRSEEMHRWSSAASYTAWGVFNWVSSVTLHWYRSDPAAH